MATKKNIQTADDLPGRLVAAISLTAPGSLDIARLKFDSDDGLLTFSVNFVELEDKSGVPVADMLRVNGCVYQRLGASYTDMTGELIVRRNLARFLQFVISLPEGVVFGSAGGVHHHLRFGVKANATENRLTYNFHISLLHAILSETLMTMKGA